MSLSEQNTRPWTIPLSLLALYGVVFTVCAIAPYDRAVWWAENIPGKESNLQ